MKLSTKVIQLNHKLTPGSQNSWTAFYGEFKSVIDSSALAALNRGTPYTLADALKRAPTATLTEQAELCNTLNAFYEECGEYISS